jgi:hypothetical protein
MDAKLQKSAKEAATEPIKSLRQLAAAEGSCTR